MMSSMTPRVTPTPTTTYPFAFTTYSTSLPPSTFTTPTAIPSIFSFGPGLSCAANSVATPLPSNHPKDHPWGLKAACMISNDRDVNPHAFWDLYACCKGFDMTAGGSPNICSAQCSVGNEQTWQELGECLSKRVEVVVCKPQFLEMGDDGNGSGNGTRSSASGTQTRTSSESGSASASATSQVSPSTGAGSANTVVHVGGSKAGVAVFAVLVLGSFAGMML